jgi:hypothetical protein
MRPGVHHEAELRVARDRLATPARALAGEAVARDGAEAGGYMVGFGQRGGALGGRVLDVGRLHRSFLAKRGTSEAWGYRAKTSKNSRRSS